MRVIYRRVLFPPHGIRGGGLVRAGSDVFANTPIGRGWWIAHPSACAEPHLDFAFDTLAGVRYPPMTNHHECRSEVSYGALDRIKAPLTCPMPKFCRCVTALRSSLAGRRRSPVCCLPLTVRGFSASPNATTVDYSSTCRCSCSLRCPVPSTRFYQHKKEVGPSLSLS